MVTATFASLVGFGLIMAALTAVFFSPYRRWLGFMLAGMVFWGLLEAVRFSVQRLFELPMTYSYLTAVMVAMASVTYILLKLDSLAQKTLANRQYIEHTPVYEDD